MLMNMNAIEFNSFLITVPKLDSKQYMLLRHLLSSIQNPHDQNNVFFMSINLFPNMDENELKALLKRNIEITVVNKKTGVWSNFHVINDIEINKDRIYFTPAKLIREIVDASERSQKKSFLRYILFNGIRFKQTLLLIDHILKQPKPFFEVSVSDLKKIFELSEETYKNYNTFKVRVIDKAVKEINEKTSLRVEYNVTGKKGKKIEKLTFEFYDKGEI